MTERTMTREEVEAARATSRGFHWPAADPHKQKVDKG